MMSIRCRTVALALACALLLAPLAPAAPMSLSGAQVEVGFSPEGTALPLVLKVINGAQRDIEMAAFSLSSRPIAQALVAAARRGVQVRIVADAKQNSESYSVVPYLVGQGIPVRLNDRYGELHSKYMLVDGRHLQNGSFNYSAAAVSRNAENVVVTWNTRQLVEIFQTDWMHLWKEGYSLTIKN